MRDSDTETSSGKEEKPVHERDADLKHNKSMEQSIASMQDSFPDGIEEDEEIDVIPSTINTRWVLGETLIPATRLTDKYYHFTSAELSNLLKSTNAAQIYFTLAGTSVSTGVAGLIALVTQSPFTAKQEITLLTISYTALATSLIFSVLCVLSFYRHRRMLMDKVLTK